MDQNEEPLERLASQPKSVESDGQKVESHSLREQIELDRYIESKKAMKRGSLGFRLTKMRAGGI